MYISNRCLGVLTTLKNFLTRGKNKRFVNVARVAWCVILTIFIFYFFINGSFILDPVERINISLVWFCFFIIEVEVTTTISFVLVVKISGLSPTTLPSSTHGWTQETHLHCQRVLSCTRNSSLWDSRSSFWLEGWKREEKSLRVIWRVLDMIPGRSFY